MHGQHPTPGSKQDEDTNSPSNAHKGSICSCSRKENGHVAVKSHPGGFEELSSCSTLSLPCQTVVRLLSGGPPTEPPWKRSNQDKSNGHICREKYQRLTGIFCAFVANESSKTTRKIKSRKMPVEFPGLEYLCFFCLPAGNKKGETLTERLLNCSMAAFN